jgi:hypothetical protein
MSNRMEVLTELSTLCGRNRMVALGVMGYATGAMTLEQLQEALAYAQDLTKEWDEKNGYLALWEERYGRNLLPE